MAMLESEKELEDYLYDNYKKGEIECVLNLFGGGQLFRQVSLGNYGVMDLVLVDFDLDFSETAFPKTYITIIELKKGFIDYNALTQISRYRIGIISLIAEKWKVNSSNKFKFEIRGVIIGGQINSTSDLVYLFDNIEWLDTYTYKLNLDNGLTLNSTGSGWYEDGERFSSAETHTPELFSKFLQLYREARRRINKKNKQK